MVALSKNGVESNITKVLLKLCLIQSVAMQFRKFVSGVKSELRLISVVWNDCHVILFLSFVI